MTRPDTDLTRLLGDLAGVAWERHGNHLNHHWVSRRVTELLGYTQEEWLTTGRNWQGALHPDDEHETLEAYTAGLSSGRPFTLQYRLRDHGGAYRPMLDVITPRYSSTGDLTGAAGLIIPHGPQDRSLERSEQRWRAMVQHSSDVTVLLTRSGEFSYVSPSVTTVLGYNHQTATGPNTRPLIHEDDRPALRAVLRRLNTEGPGASATLTHRLLAADGTWRTFETTLTNLQHHPAVQATVLNARDVTERTLAEHRLQDSRDRLIVSTHLASLGALTAGLAHEINTPLAAALNSLLEAQTLATEYRASITSPGVTPEDHHEIADDLLRALALTHSSAARIGEFVRQMRDHTRNSTRGETDFSPLRVAADTLAMLAHSARAIGASLNLEEPVHRGLVIRGDRGYFSQILLNLASNALQACENTNRPGVVTVRLLASTAGLHLQVEDNGHGIEAAVLPHIFDTLFTTRTAGSGTGLGLSIIRDLVHTHFKGRITVNTTPGQGSTFTVHLHPDAESEHP